MILYYYHVIYSLCITLDSFKCATASVSAVLRSLERTQCLLGGSKWNRKGITRFTYGTESKSRVATWFSLQFWFMKKFSFVRILLTLTWSNRIFFGSKMTWRMLWKKCIKQLSWIRKNPDFIISEVCNLTATRSRHSQSTLRFN